MVLLSKTYENNFIDILMVQQLLWMFHKLKRYVDGTDLYVAGYSTRTLYKVSNPLSTGYINASKYPSNSNLYQPKEILK